MARRNSKNNEKKVNNVEYNVEVTRAIEFKSGDVAFDMVVNGVTIYNCYVRQTKKGDDFIAFPSRKGNDGKYYSYTYFPIDDDLLQNILDQIDAKLN